MVSAVQLPAASLPPTPLPLDPALFRPGSTLEALVLGKTVEGLTQLQIGDLLVLAKLPQSPPPGTMLQLSVKSGGPVPELTVAVLPAPVAATVLPTPVVVQPLPPMPASSQGPAASPPAPAISVGPSQAQPATLLPLTQIVAGTPPGVSSPGVGSPPSTAPRIPTPPPGSPPGVQSPSGAAIPVAPVGAGPVAAPVAAQLTTVAPMAAATGSSVAAASNAVPLSVSTPAPMQAGSPASSALSLAQVPVPTPLSVRVVPTTAPVVQQSPPQPSTPQAALAQMVPAALGQQGSPVPLFQALSAVLASAVPLPAPVLRAAQQVLANRVPAGALSGEVLKAAVERSGVSMEAILRTGAPPAAADTKVGLLALRSALVAMLGDLAPVDPVRRVPPPIKGEVLRAQIADPAPDLPASLQEVGRALHGHTEAALSRLKLMQLASLPDADGARQSLPELRLEIPLLVGSELAMAQLQIFRDQKRERDTGKRGWTMRFAIATDATGEVGAELGLIDKSVTVALWAAEVETADALRDSIPELVESLASQGLRSSVHVRSRPPNGPISAPGTFVDRGT